MSKRERVDAALQGAPVDRVPVAAWRHFIPGERSVDALAAASLKHFEEFDWDWLKLNPRATYYAEAWGNRYDFGSYAGVYPRLLEGQFDRPKDLGRLAPVPDDHRVFVEQYDLIRAVRAGIGDAHFVQTVFSPLSVLGFLLGRPAHHTAAEVVQSHADALKLALAENPAGVHQALTAISQTLAAYAARAVDAGASGLFFAIVKLARRGALSEAEYAAFGRPYDLQVLEAVRGAPFNLLHVCGPAVYFDAVSDYPVHALNWASIGQENPTISEALRRTDKALIGGVDEDGALQTGTTREVTVQARRAITETGGRRLLLAPGCGVKMDVPEANLQALRQAVEL
jgi:uroporphyrinogen decarboxylase